MLPMTLMASNNDNITMMITTNSDSQKQQLWTPYQSIQAITKNVKKLK